MVRHSRPAGAIVTHVHEDHSGGAAILAARGVPLALQPETERRLRHPQASSCTARHLGILRTARRSVTPFTPNGIELIATPAIQWITGRCGRARTGTLFAGALFLGSKFHCARRRGFHAAHRLAAKCAALAPARMLLRSSRLVPNAVSALVAKADWLAEMVSLIRQRTTADGATRPIVARRAGGDN